MLKPQAGKPTKRKSGTMKPSAKTAKTQRDFDPQSPENEIDFKN